jgi:hypothetical protein
MTTTRVANGGSHPSRMRTLRDHLMSCALRSRLVLAPPQQMFPSPGLSLLDCEVWRASAAGAIPKVRKPGHDVALAVYTRRLAPTAGVPHAQS